jgi:hypothetical protein
MPSPITLSNAKLRRSSLKLVREALCHNSPQPRDETNTGNALTVFDWTSRTVRPRQSITPFW